MAAAVTLEEKFVYQYLTFRLWLRSTADATTNTSKVDYKLYLYKPDKGGRYNTSNGNSVSFTLGGRTIANTANWGTINIAPYEMQAGVEFVLYSGSITVNHASDGSGSVAYSATFRQTQPAFDLNATISGTYILDKIQRASSITISPTTASIGSTINMTISRAVSSYTHTLRWKSATQSSYTQIATGVGTSYSWTVPQAVAEAVTNGASGTITIQCETFSGSNSLGSKTATFTMNTPAEWVPTISSIGVTDGNGYKATYGSFLQSLSTFQVVITASGSHGSTISSYSTAISNLGTYSGASFTTAAVGSSGQFTLTTTVTDSRGRMAQLSTTVTVAPYISPAISALVYRCDSTGQQSDMAGEYVRIESNVAWQDDITGNELTVVWRYKLASASSYGSDITIQNPSDTITAGFLIGENYDIQIQATDDFRSSTVQFRINNAEFPIDILYDSTNGPGIAMGKAATKHRTLDVAWDLEVWGDAYFHEPIVKMDILKSAYPVSGTNTYAIDWQDYDVLVFGVQQYSNRLDSIVMSTAWFRTTNSQKRPYSQAHTLSANSQINYQIYQSGEGSVTVIHSGANPGSEYGFYLEGVKFGRA